MYRFSERFPSCQTSRIKNVNLNYDLLTRGASINRLTCPFNTLAVGEREYNHTTSARTLICCSLSGSTCARDRSAGVGLFGFEREKAASNLVDCLSLPSQGANSRGSVPAYDEKRGH